MLVIIAAYVLAFFTIGWGSAIISLFLMPVSLLFGRGTAGRVAGAITNGAGTFLATYAVNWICGWLEVDIAFLMLLIPLYLMVSNDLNRIRQAQTAESFAGVDISDEPEIRQGMISTERNNLAADLIGYAIAIALLSPMPIF